MTRLSSCFYPTSLFSLSQHNRSVSLQLEHHDTGELGTSGSGLASRDGTGTTSDPGPGPDPAPEHHRPVHPEGDVSVGGRQRPTFPVEAEDKIKLSWRQYFDGVMTYLILFGWPLVLFSVLGNVVLTVAWMRARRRKDHTKSQCCQAAERQRLNPVES